MNEQQVIEILQKLDLMLNRMLWVVGSIMFIAGFLPIIAFFLGKGEK